MDGETGGRGKLDEQRSLERRSHLGRRPSDVRRNKVGKVRRFKYSGFAEWFETVSISRNPYTNTTETSLPGVNVDFAFWKEGDLVLNRLLLSALLARGFDRHCTGHDCFPSSVEGEPPPGLEYRHNVVGEHPVFYFNLRAILKPTSTFL